MLFLINFNRRDKTRGVNGTGWESYVQGLDACAEDIAAMDQNRAQIRQILNTKVRSIIDRWVAYCIKKNEMGRVAFLYAHSAFLWYNISQEDLTPDVLVSFLSSQLFLATRFHGSSQRLGKNAPLKRKLSKADAGEMYGNGMQCELFDIFQKHKLRLFHFGNTNDFVKQKSTLIVETFFVSSLTERLTRKSSA
jgi:hypothetical protein